MVPSRLTPSSWCLVVASLVVVLIGCGSESDTSLTDAVDDQASAATATAGACDPTRQPAPHWGVRDGWCRPSCGGLGGTNCQPSSCPSGYAPVANGPSYDCGACCVQTATAGVCNPTTQPSPDWGVRDGVCRKSCGQLGGTSCEARSCPAGYAPVANGPSYDCGACCVPTATAGVCNPTTQPSPHWGVKDGVCRRSCGQLGGTSCQASSCPAGSVPVADGPSYDCGACCKSASASAFPTFDDLWNRRAAFAVDQDPVPVRDSYAGHREAFAVNRTDIGARTVYLYHRCFLPGSDASICLSLSSDGGQTFPNYRGQVVAPEPGHIFAVAPSVAKVGNTWVMVYEESNVAAVYWAESSDGLTWQRRGLLIGHGGGGAWDAVTATPGIFVDQGRIYVFYAGFAAGATDMNIGYAAGTSMTSLSKYSGNPVFRHAASGWDGGHVSMPKVVREGSWYYMIYEGADLDYTCNANNRYGFGVARSSDLRAWERFAANPIRRSADGCGNDMPSPFVRYDGKIFAYHTSDDTRRIVRETVR
ncbi:MAG: hypothetical protein HY903_09230 [Deltaproteobacteria bacterium]|nr:hypothetical protein [Deltaproteobacteria bacterium]